MPMSAAALTVMLCAALPAQTSVIDNFDLHNASLDGWRGKGFYLTTASQNGPSVALGLCSSDRGGPPISGTLRYTFTVPQGAGQLRCTAYAARRKDCPADDRLNLFVITSTNDVVPMQVGIKSGWKATPLLLQRMAGKPREYCWDLADYAGQRVQIVLQDKDDRPGCYVFCSGFRLNRQGENEEAEFTAFIRQIESKQKMPPLARYETKHFSAWSNADATFTRSRLRNCEMMYSMFLDHFRKRGFAVHPPAAKLLVSVFDSQAGFEVCLGQKMPAGVTGLYNPHSNQLVLYDLQENDIALSARQRAMMLSSANNPQQSKEFLGTVERRISDWALTGSLSTAMHETAHQVSFNCGLLNRRGDLPLWLCEGMACYCEATDRGSWQGIGEPNQERIVPLAEVLAGRGHFIPLKVLVEGDRWRDHSGAVLLGYAQSWALFRMLMQERPEEMRTYLQLISTRRTPEHRLEDFAQAFGSDVGRLETHYYAYITDVVRKNSARLRQW